MTASRASTGCRVTAALAALMLVAGAAVSATARAAVLPDRVAAHASGRSKLAGADADTTAPPSECSGRAAVVHKGRSRRRRLRFSLSCQYGLYSFAVSANRTLRAVFSPDQEFVCSRRGPRSFHCADIHAGSLSTPPGVAILASRCRPGAEVILQITVYASPDQPGPQTSSLSLSTPC